jgi:hypothetical protein
MRGQRGIRLGNSGNGSPAGGLDSPALAAEWRNGGVRDLDGLRRRIRRTYSQALASYRKEVIRIHGRGVGRRKSIAREYVSAGSKKCAAVAEICSAYASAAGAAGLSLWLEGTTHGKSRIKNQRIVCRYHRFGTAIRSEYAVSARANLTIRSGEHFTGKINGRRIVSGSFNRLIAGFISPDTASMSSSQILMRFPGVRFVLTVKDDGW